FYKDLTLVASDLTFRGARFTYGRESVIGWTQRRSIEKPICCRFSLVDISVSRSTMIDCSEARSGEELRNLCCRSQKLGGRVCVDVDYGMKNLNNAER
ncbi:hypothetical protein S245_051080, partial [Arachis hypogaea]